MSNLRLINETEVTSSVSSVDITDVFSADFDIYKITAETSSNSTSHFGANARLINSSGSVIPNSIYDRALWRMRIDTTFGEIRFQNDTNLESFFGTLDLNPEIATNVVYVFNPFSSSSYTFFLKQGMSLWSGFKASDKYIGVAKTTVSCTGYNVYSSNSNFFETGTVFRTYGLRVDS